MLYSPDISSINYLISFIFALELYYLYKEDKEKALYNLEKIILLNCNSEEEYYNTVSHESMVAVPLSEYQELQVVLKHLYPTNEGDKYYEIKSYCLVNVNSPEIDEGLNLIQ